MVLLTSLAKLEVLCSNQSVTGGLIRPTKISLPSKVLISAGRKQSPYPDQHQPFFALFYKLSMLFAIYVFLESYNCTTATLVYL